MQINLLNHHVVIIMISVVIILLFASLGVYLFRNKPAINKNYSELYLRIRSWWIIILLLFTSIIISKNTIIYFWGFISFLALKEYLTLVPTRRSDRRVLFWAYLAILIQYYLVYIHWYIMFLVFIPVYMFLIIPLRMITIGDTKGFLHSLGLINWGLMACVFALSHLAYLCVLNPAINLIGGQYGFFLDLLILTQFNDIAQYVCGKSFGKNKIIPKVSPNKTTEGFIGGAIITTILSIILGLYLTPMNILQCIFIGILIATLGFIGDVTMSAIKRDLGVKDTSNFIPGHGGVLDRIDSLTYAAPVYFHVISYFFN